MHDCTNEIPASLQICVIKCGQCIHWCLSRQRIAYKWYFFHHDHWHGPLTRYAILWFAHALEIPRIVDLDLHHGTCVTHVPRYMPGSLISGFLWNRWRGNRVCVILKIKGPISVVEQLILLYKMLRSNRVQFNPRDHAHFSCFFLDDHNFCPHSCNKREGQHS